MNNSMIKLAIFASGNGSNAENIAKYFQNSDSVSIDSIYTNKQEAYVLKRAKSLNIEAFYYSNKDFREGNKILLTLKKREINCIILAGFLLKIPENIIKEFPNKILNIHPALLPKYGGKGMYGNAVHKAVKAAGEKESGITIHLVNKHYDKGSIIFQARCIVDNSDSYMQIADKVHKLEYDNYPKVIESFVLSKD